MSSKDKLLQKGFVQNSNDDLLVCLMDGAMRDEIILHPWNGFYFVTKKGKKEIKQA